MSVKLSFVGPLIFYCSRFPLKNKVRFVASGPIFLTMKSLFFFVRLRLDLATFASLDGYSLSVYSLLFNVPPAFCPMWVWELRLCPTDVYYPYGESAL